MRINKEELDNIYKMFSRIFKDLGLYSASKKLLSKEKLYLILYNISHPGVFINLWDEIRYILYDKYGERSPIIASCILAWAFMNDPLRQKIINTLGENYLIELILSERRYIKKFKEDIFFSEKNNLPEEYRLLYHYLRSGKKIII